MFLSKIPNNNEIWEMNIPIIGSGQIKAQEKCAEIAKEFGYTGIVFTTIINNRVLNQNDSLPLKKCENIDIKQKFRLHYHINDAASYRMMTSSNPVLKSYDILSVCPETESAFHHACKQLGIDIISLDFTKRLSFHIKKVHVNMAIKRHIYFEIKFGDALKDSVSRRNIISNTLNLINMTRGKNIIISCGSGNWMDLRTPHDVKNLALFFGIRQKLVKSVQTTNIYDIFVHALTRETEKGVIHVEEEMKN